MADGKRRFKCWNMRPLPRRCWEKKINSFLDFDFLSDYAWIFGEGAVLAGLGYLIRGLWGSFIPLLIGAFVSLYMKDFLPF
jgi:hypothetical protein